MAGTAGKYHINAKGEPEVCTATVRSCPYGATGHYDTPGEAKVAMEKIWKEKVLGKDNASTLSKKTNTGGKQSAKKYLASRDEMIKEFLNRSNLHWRDKLIATVKSINATVSKTDPKQKQYLSIIDEYQMEAANLLGNKSDMSRANPDAPWRPREESPETRKERAIIDQQLGYQRGNGELNYTSVPSESFYNSVIGGSDSVDAIYSARTGLTEPVFDDEIGIDSKIGIAPVQSLNYRVNERNNDYDVIFTVTDDDLIRAGVNKNSISIDNPDLRFSVDVSDPVLYKNARYMQAYVGHMNREVAKTDSSKGKDDNGEEKVVYLDSKPTLWSVTRMRVPGVAKPSWVFRFHGKAAINPDDDQDFYLYS